MKIIACNSSKSLAEKISKHIDVPLADASVRTFNDREIFVEINENIRGEDVFIIQSTSHPANDHLMELLITIDAARRGSAKRITAVIPYYGYARQDRKTGPRTPITAKLVANLITSAGADRVLTMDLHAGQIQGFFDIPLDNIFFIQSVSSPANDNLMEMLLCIDALKRSSAKNITAVIPYFGYARQDRKVVPRTSISAKLVSNLITKAGADRVVTVDLHAGQIQGFFDIPVDNLFTTPLFARHIKKKIKSKNIICVAPDVGGVERTRALGRNLNVGLAIIDKRRPKPGQSQVMNVIGDVKGKTCIINDDIIDSGGTIINAAKALKQRGAKDVYVYITHGVLSGDAVKAIKNSPIKKLVITDTINNENKVRSAKNIEILSISNLMGEAIRRISNSTSVSFLFK